MFYSFLIVILNVCCRKYTTQKNKFSDVHTSMIKLEFPIFVTFQVHKDSNNETRKKDSDFYVVLWTFLSITILCFTNKKLWEIFIYNWIYFNMENKLMRFNYYFFYVIWKMLFSTQHTNFQEIIMIFHLQATQWFRVLIFSLIIFL